MYPGRGWRILTRSNRQPKGAEMTPRSILIALAALAVAALVPASAAAAGGKKAPRQATFKAQISGNQDITWSYSKTANGPCTADNYGNGEARIQFDNTQPREGDRVRDQDSTDGPGSELRGSFDNCPYWNGGPYWHSAAEGDIEPVDEPLKEAKLFDRKSKKIVVHGGDVNCFDESGFTVCGQEAGPFKGKIVTAWKLTLKRVK
jgi:hypothetical protein